MIFETLLVRVFVVVVFSYAKASGNLQLPLAQRSEHDERSGSDGARKRYAVSQAHRRGEQCTTVGDDAARRRDVSLSVCLLSRGRELRSFEGLTRLDECG